MAADADAPASSPTGKVYYVATDGDDANPGSKSRPFATWQRLNGVLKAGDAAYIRGGKYTRSVRTQYQCRWTGLKGTAAAPIRIWAYPGETPVWDFSGGLRQSVTPYLIQMYECDHVHVKGLRVTGAAQPANGSPVLPWNVTNCHDVVIERCTVDHHGGYGFTIGHEGWNLGDKNTEPSSDVLFLNCDSYANEDARSPKPYDGSDGFNVTHNTSSKTQVRNTWAKDVTFDGCRAWHNSDDGWDFYGCDSSLITIRNCWAFLNGKNEKTGALTGNGIGFKMGPNYTDRSADYQFLVHGCLAVANRGAGFDQNTRRHTSIHKLYNNFAYANDIGFYFKYGALAKHVFRNNAAYQNRKGAADADLDATTIVHDHNTWNGGVKVTAADFQSLDHRQLLRPRRPDGSLPVITFGRLAPGSRLRGAGVGVGLKTDGTGRPWGAPPSIGAYEFAEKPVAPKPPETKPPAKAGTAPADDQPQPPQPRQPDPKAAQMYRSARSAERAGMQELAKILYERLVKEFPDDPLAAKARGKVGE